VRFKTVLLALIALCALGTLSFGAQINGSASFAAFGVTLHCSTPPCDLSNVDSITTSRWEESDAVNGSGDYSGVASGDRFSDGGSIVLSDLVDFTLTSTIPGGEGGFVGDTTDGIHTTHIVTQSADFLDIYIFGSYDGLPGFADTPSSYRMSFTKSGSSVSGSATLASPPAALTTTPEPATMALFGSALVGLGLIGRRRKKA